MNRFAFVLLLLVATAATAAEVDQGLVRVVTVFDGTLQVSGVPVLVTERAVSVTKGAPPRELGAGFRVVYLHSGAVIATIDGKPERHRGGDYWTVPDGATFTVEVTSEMAVLRVTSLVRQK
jgi:hypothetical protein